MEAALPASPKLRVALGCAGEPGPREEGPLAHGLIGAAARRNCWVRPRKPDCAWSHDRAIPVAVTTGPKVMASCAIEHALGLDGLGTCQLVAPAVAPGARPPGLPLPSVPTARPWPPGTQLSGAWFSALAAESAVSAGLRRYAGTWLCTAARMPSHRRARALRARLTVSAHSAHLAPSSPHRSASICIAIGVCSSPSTWMWRAR
jgi:hypothetical protein